MINNLYISVIQQYTMKKILILLQFLLITIISNSQSSLLVNDKLPLDSLFENKDENLIISKVLEFEGLKKEEFERSFN